MTDEFVAVDWGSTHLRLRLLSAPEAGRPAGIPSAQARVLGEHRSADGAGVVAAGEYQKVFIDNLKRLLLPLEKWEAWHSLGGQVYLSGMVTSSIGWCPTPYLPVPAGPAELMSGLVEKKLGKLQLRFLPGLRTRADVMRGEEAEAFGISQAMGSRDAILVLPGTHSKWIRLTGGKIADFLSVPTGDLYAGLHQATLLARTLPQKPPGVEGPLVASFDRGVELARSEGPLASLFKVRSLALLENLGREAASALLSGVLIAGEILERVRGAVRPGSLLLGGAPPLRGLYLRAFALLKVPVEEVPADLASRASAEGLRHIRSLAAAAPAGA